jgi:hypothetical protein
MIRKKLSRLLTAALSVSALGYATLGLAETGLDFPGSAAVSTTMRFRFSNPLQMYPATYIWRVYPRQQAGYYTTFFWGNDGEFWWDNGNPNSYYGAHPYPQPPPSGTSHKWEIATDFGGDYLSSQSVVYDRWYTQALVAWSDGSGKHTRFYWDLPDQTKVISVDSSSTFANKSPPKPALTFGDAPWAPGNEVHKGILRAIRVYSTNLSLADIQAEATTPLSTTAGASSIWYLNMDPTPTDISDKSGLGHNPSWVGSERPSLYTSGTSSTPNPPTNLTVTD